ncbi:uncharacterized protein [Amphiura filiformis]|uniref:uncharacterized protein n=1 Tax=Amphiura filiformis TaxID=82378 RepID=UPI003B211DAB
MPDPEKDSSQYFKHHFKSQNVSFVVYADFESFPKPNQTCQPEVSQKTTKYQKHEPSGIFYYIKCFDDSVYTQEPVIFTKESEDQDVAQIFVETLEQNIKEIHQQFKFQKEMIFGEQEREILKKSTHCHIYRGEIDCIPSNEEKYISFTKKILVDTFTNKEGKEVDVKRDLRFIDSFKFMAAGLGKLVENLDEFFELPKFYQDEQLQLLLRKGVYPYDHVNSLEKLQETSLPPKDTFYSKLNEEHISDEDYEHAQKVWNTFEMKTMREYHDLYLKSDVLRLADVFESFRKLCLKNYKLDPCWYYTAPGLSYDAMLKTTGVKLELLVDYDMAMMIEKGIRGGVSMISTRYSEANNKYMGSDYDPSKPSKYIQYLDNNNLYGSAMSQPLPTGGFEWMTPKQLDSWDEIPCILEVDLEYPKKLHDLHNDYPLAPERVTVNRVEKLIPNLGDKEKYVIHHTALKQCLDLGLKLTKIHRGITFNESPFMKKYIDLNTELRKNANSEFEKDFFKLMNNSVFGKTMENIRNRVNIHLVNSEHKAIKLAAKPNYERNTIFDENLIAVHMKKIKLYFNKPIYLGMSILDISKTMMYDFHYNYIKKKYGNKAKLCLTDTDSLLYEIETEDFYKDIAQDVDRYFDTSNYPADHPSGIPTGKNKKVPGMFKDEAGGKQIVEFVGLRAKLYSFRMHEGNEEKRCKGVRKRSSKERLPSTTTNAVSSMRNLRRER